METGSDLMSYRINGSYGIQNKGNVNKNNDLRKSVNRNNFQTILNDKIYDKNVKISSHAQKRLNQRNVELSSKDLHKLGQAMDKAEAKGAKESLVLYRNIAFITNIENRTIITAVDKGSSREDVFTNIDSAVILD